MYKPPRIEAVSHHFVPDNSGDCCVICFNGSSDPMVAYDCSVCHWPPNMLSEDPEAIQQQFIAKLPDPKLWELANKISHHEPMLCVRDVYALRNLDGQAKLICLYCLQRHYKLDQLEFCHHCHFLCHKSNVMNGQCNWCFSEGTQLSILQACGAFNDFKPTPDEKSIIAFLFSDNNKTQSKDSIMEKLGINDFIIEPLLDKLVEKRLLCKGLNGYSCSINKFADIIESVKIRWAEYGNEIRTDSNYDKLVDLLASGEYRDLLKAEYGDLDLQDDEIWFYLLLSEVGMGWVQHNHESILRFITEHEAHRFSRSMWENDEKIFQIIPTTDDTIEGD